MCGVVKVRSHEFCVLRYGLWHAWRRQASIQSSRRNINKTTRIAAAADAKGADGRPWCALHVFGISFFSVRLREVWRNCFPSVRVHYSKQWQKDCAPGVAPPQKPHRDQPQRKLVPESVERAEAKVNAALEEFRGAHYLLCIFGTRRGGHKFRRDKNKSKRINNGEWAWARAANWNTSANVKRAKISCRLSARWCWCGECQLRLSPDGTGYWIQKMLFIEKQRILRRSCQLQIINNNGERYWHSTFGMTWW